jgi:alpha-glucosidase
LTRAISTLRPPERGFFSKRLKYKGIPIKAAAVVSDKALVEAYHRLHRMLQHQPNVAYNLARAGAQLHIIGKNQVTSDLPEHRALKGKKLSQYGGQTVDERTRGLGGLLTSCGEENLLRLDLDRYWGRDICIHEFAHNIQDNGVSAQIRRRIRQQYHQSLGQGLWKGSYAASNESEFFAELTMWYFGTHGDRGMTGAKPADGPQGLRAYDLKSYQLLDDFYSGRIKVSRISLKPSRRKK